MGAFISVEPDVLEIYGLTVDADYRRRNPVAELARLAHPPHQQCNACAIFRRSQPFVHECLPLIFASPHAFGLYPNPHHRTAAATERLVRPPTAEPEPHLPP